MRVVRSAARQLAGADGATFVLRESGGCYYADEDAIAPLWKGRRFPMEACISGWVMRHGQPVVIEDIDRDPRIPKETYHTTFVRSLTMVPIRIHQPIGAIGCYWATRGRAEPEQVQWIQALADSTSTAIENAQLYSELDRRARLAESAVQLRDEFLTAAAHELRTPLTTLQLQLDLLARSAQAGSEVSVERIERARTSSLKLADLIAMMLDASHLTEGEMVLSPGPCDVVSVIDAGIARFRAEAERAGCALIVEAPPSACGHWDKARLHQIVATLLANALRRGPGKPITIRIQAGTQLDLSIHDNGPTIAPADLDKVFERFARVGPELAAGRLGLGLYVVRLVAEAHGGSVSADRDDGQGMAVHVLLPWRSA